jgi:flagellar hook-length control protein FliK
MTLRLEPAELGQVQIRIDRPQDAPAQVDISVQRPETLTLLLRDQPQLQRALDQAGVPADGRSLTLHVAPPDTPASSSNSHPGVAAGGDPGQGGGGGAGTRAGGQDRSGGAADPDQDDTSAPLPRWLRVGLDITA